MRNEALSKTSAVAQTVGLSKKGWRSEVPTQIIHRSPESSQNLCPNETSRQIIVDFQDVNDDSNSDTSTALPTQIFKPINFNPKPAFPFPSTSSPLPSTTPHPPQQPKREEVKLRVDSALDLIVEPDLSDFSFQLNDFKRWSNAEMEKGIFEKFDSEAENEATPLTVPMASPPCRGEILGYFEL